MTIHLHRQIEKLKGMIHALGTQTEEAVESATRAVETRDSALARRVIDSDAAIDQLEVEIEEECLHTLALHQPVAFDLRYVVAVLKINNDLERIADHAVSIAEQAVFLADEPHMDLGPFEVGVMAGLVREMLRKSRRAMVNVDDELADAVRIADDRVDAIHRGMYKTVETSIRERPERAGQFIHLLSLSRQYERIADLAVNIAEDVVYMARGDILRHRGESV